MVRPISAGAQIEKSTPLSRYNNSKIIYPTICIRIVEGNDKITLQLYFQKYFAIIRRALGESEDC